jgi:hypothetical protein
MITSDQLAEQWLQTFVNRLTGQTTLTKIAAEFKEDLTNKVYDYLKENYPEDVLDWVKDAEWSLQDKVPLSKIKMARRPGGAREQDKVKGIAEAVKEGKPMEPVVLVKLSDGTYKIADGYHRTLGFQKAGKSFIRAYVAVTDSDKGKWDKEMHEKKLNIGKKANEENYELVKLAGLGGGLIKGIGGLAKGIGTEAVNFGKGITGLGVRKAKQQVNQLGALKDLHGEHVNNYSQTMYDLQPHINPGHQANADSVFANGIKNQTDKSLELNDQFHAAKQNLKKEKWNMAKSYGIATLGTGGTLAANHFKKVDQQNQLYQQQNQQELQNQSMNMMQNNPYM